MTSKLEKQFFDTFGIEPNKKQESKLVAIGENIRGLKRVEKPFYDYPQITDRHYLELICILCKRDYDYNLGISGSVEELKNYLLRDCIEYVSDIKHQVRALFGESND